MNKKLNREKELETILTLCVALMIIFFLNKQKHAYWLLFALAIGLIGLFSKFLTGIIALSWLKLTEIIGAVSSKIILSLVFFLLLVPIAFLSKVFGKTDSLQLKKRSGDSYYITRNHVYTGADLKNVW